MGDFSGECILLIFSFWGKEKKHFISKYLLSFYWMVDYGEKLLKANIK